MPNKKTPATRSKKSATRPKTKRAMPRASSRTHKTTTRPTITVAHPAHRSRTPKTEQVTFEEYFISATLVLMLLVTGFAVSIASVVRARSAVVIASTLESNKLVRR